MLKVKILYSIILIDEFKTRFEKLGQIVKEIAQKDDRTIFTYDDAEKALKLIRTGNKQGGVRGKFMLCIDGIMDR